MKLKVDWGVLFVLQLQNQKKKRKSQDPDGHQVIRHAETRAGTFHYCKNIEKGLYNIFKLFFHNIILSEQWNSNVISSSVHFGRLSDEKCKQPSAATR